MTTLVSALAGAALALQSNFSGDEPQEYRNTAWSNEWHIVTFARDVSGAAFIGKRGLSRVGDNVSFKVLVVFNHKLQKKLGHDQELVDVEGSCSTRRVRQASSRLRLAHGPDRLAQPTGARSDVVPAASMVGMALDTACGRKPFGERAYFPYTFAHAGFRSREGTMFADPAGERG